MTGLDVIFRDEYLLEDFLRAVAASPDERCLYCYTARLDAAAAEAARLGFEAFTTTLLYSRYQKHDAIREIGEQLGDTYGIRFHYVDFRQGWQKGIDISRQLALYRQQYCGCIYSEKERYHPRKGP
jgi:predicted adenine nucleotide alpha hydrolase (AANH) superfamily ATPase